MTVLKAVFCGFVVAGVLLVSNVWSAASAPLPAVQQGRNLADCVTKLFAQDGGWCEIRAEAEKLSISSVWPSGTTNMPPNLHMSTGPQSVLIAWNSAAFDKARNVMYFTGGGHADYGGNEVYEFDLNTGKWSRLTDPSPLDRLHVVRDYGESKSTPWRRLCWVPNVPDVPAAAHTYGGLIFSRQTSTVFLYVSGAANGACIEDKDDSHRNDPNIVAGGRDFALGWYEFNPSRSDVRNGLKPLTWKRVFDPAALKSVGVGGGYPVSAELADGRLVFGSSTRTMVYDPLRTDAASLKPFSQQADWGDGLQLYDAKRNLVWSLHGQVLLAYDAQTGKAARKLNALVGHGKSLAFDAQGRIVSWDGKSGIYLLDPDDPDPSWKILDWSGSGPAVGDRRVYGKWVSLEQDGVFAGIATHKTGFWIYKPPTKIDAAVLSKVQVQSLINQAEPGSVVTIPPGIYSTGLYVNKPLTVKLAGVVLMGIARDRAVINVNCDQCRVILEDVEIDGRKANCLSGNCAGIKAEGKAFDLIVRRAHIDNTVMGILTDNRGGQLTIEDSLVENTGMDDVSDTVAHGIYAGKIDRLVIRRSTIRRPFGDGHIVKSRAPDTLIEDSIIAGIDGYQSRTIDFPCGGKLVVRNSTLQHGKNADNVDLISVGTEPTWCKDGVQPSDVTLRDNWIIIDRDRSKGERSRASGASTIFNWRAPVLRLDMVGNKIVDPTGELTLSVSGNLPQVLNNNTVFKSRQAAGLGPDQIPPAPSKVTVN